MGSCESFLTEYWEKKPLLRHESSPELKKIMDSTTTMKWIYETWKPKIHPDDHGQIVVLTSGSFQHNKTGWPYSSHITYQSALDGLNSGHTVVFHNMELYWPVMGEFTQHLTSFFNLYHLEI
eukprot:TRINITY_DN4873_c0_g1_i3.p1 TRINITY_DN4873_c0_g1~~TRINITY_DN4873_c0_g1_i3.p1  ORF type:complete len:122 (-),score=34.21 TRINITY_DN4873_c0_g1_i3:12-377(-)